MDWETRWCPRTYGWAHFQVALDGGAILPALSKAADREADEPDRKKGERAGFRHGPNHRSERNRIRPPGGNSDDKWITDAAAPAIGHGNPNLGRKVGAETVHTNQSVPPTPL